MKKTFDINRFCQVLKYTIVSEKKSIITAAVAFLAAFLAIQLFACFTVFDISHGLGPGATFAGMMVCNVIMGVMMGDMMVWFGWSVPAAVLLYYVTSSVWQVIQQQIVTKRVIAKVTAETEAKLAEQPVEINVVRRERKPRPKKKG